ncbi:unnamed protein product [Diplocarpon coronariae]|nr:hypothetical protein JHW43_002888 [Diplocarpon mali]
MDIMQDYAIHAIQALHTAEPYTRPVRSYISTIRAQSAPILLPYLNKAASLAQESPAILSLGVLLLLLVLIMQILAFVRRVMLFWVRLAMRLVFWACVVLLVSVVWQRGVGRTVTDAASWTEELRGVWWREYRRWEGYQTQGPVGQGQGRGANTGFGGRTNAGSKWR